ncbi:hypothetical protein MOQ_008486 [Trypanosoma cruzi marinkellei]|uniref:PDZ domain-containing protein n=1 Tax=Trypanosoma cruzi marinkellei TaxID=85056 RepID=K2MZG3_TRYCR|nr:hypothetical protein MOQ_008486 [Trypanosoma cruzi marinkellei]
MTAALNRKFDLLQKSGTCPSYLLDVLTLLVAHANETELFKQELRSAPFENAAPPLRSERKIVAAAAPQPEMGPQTVAQPAAPGAEKDVLLAAERTLRAYASDLRNINDIAIATSSKKLREMKTSNFSEMTAFRDRMVSDAVDRTREELELLRIGWLESMNTEVERAKMEVHKVGLSSQKALHKMLEGYRDYVSDGFRLLKTEPLEVMHRAMAECAFCVERLKIMEQQVVPRIEIDALCGRLKNVERVIAQLLKKRHSSGAVDDEISAVPAVGPSEAGGSTAAAEGVRPLGLCLQDGGDDVEGLIVTEVAPNSLASKARISPGHIISHVGDTLVTRKDDFTAAIQKTGLAVKITVYDPETSRVRILALQP